METIYNVNTGDVKIASNEGILRSSALGSCVAIVAFDPVKRIGGMAHIMVSGKSPNEDDDAPTRYSMNGIDALLSGMIQEGSEKDSIKTCIIGGGNVLRRKNDTIAEDNIGSVIDILIERNLPIMARSIGGFERRSVLFDIKNASLMISIGNGSLHTLYDFDSIRS